MTLIQALTYLTAAIWTGALMFWVAAARIEIGNKRYAEATTNIMAAVFSAVAAVLFAVYGASFGA